MLAHLKGAKIIVVIHDLGSFRRKKLTPLQEIKRLSNADYIIFHNGKMTKWLQEQGYKIPIGELEIFDYLSNSNFKNNTTINLPYKIIYAGGLRHRKNRFLLLLSDKTRL